ncbi:MAG: hypothetical protein HQL55_11230, partial [Magnetococcales bacterium]|nr:hypothetical protein [Magnetococcales bacterium]
QRIYPCMFRIVGGEPALNPQLCDYIQLVAELWPQSKRSLVSNGFFLHRHPDIYTTLAKTGTALHISLHDYPNGEEKDADMVTIQQKCNELGIFLAFYRGKKEDFSRTYQGEGMNMRPYRDGDAEASWKACVARCPTIHRGLLWKCPPLAFLDLIEDRFKLRQNPEWVPYLDHKGLSLDASDEEILSYLYFSIPECDMCPSTPQPV